MLSYMWLNTFCLVIIYFINLEAIKSVNETRIGYPIIKDIPTSTISTSKLIA